MEADQIPGLAKPALQDGLGALLQVSGRTTSTTSAMDGSEGSGAHLWPSDQPPISPVYVAFFAQGRLHPTDRNSAVRR